MQSRLIRLIRVVFSNGTMFSVSDKYDSVNKCTEEMSELLKLHNQGVWQNAHTFIRQLAHAVGWLKTTVLVKGNETDTAQWCVHKRCTECTLVVA